MDYLDKTKMHIVKIKKYQGHRHLQYYQKDI